VIPFAPITFFVDWLTTDKEWRRTKARDPSTIGVEALRVARGELGKGESGGNNRGDDVDRYRGSLRGTGAWCSAFVGYCLAQACQRLVRAMPVQRSNGARQLFRRIVTVGWKVKYHDMQPGDVVLFARGPEGSWKAHVAFVSQVRRSTTGRVTRFSIIEGNAGSYPARVREIEATKRKRRIGFARV